MANLLVTVDGSCHNKRMAIGIVIRDVDSQKLLDSSREEILDRSGTSNQAEYIAIIRGCLKAAAYKGAPHQITIYTDSQLIIRQLMGMYAVRSGRLKKLYQRAREVLKQNATKVKWHRRDEGDGPLADKLASNR